MGTVIEDFLQFIKSGKSVYFYCFYQELPIKFKAEFLESNDNSMNIAFMVRSDIDIGGVLREEKEVYSKFNGEVLVFRVYDYDDSVMLTSYPYLHKVPQMDRKYIRVRCPLRNPIYLVLDGQTVMLKDISDVGFSFEIDKDYRVGDILEGVMVINGQEFPLKFKIKNKWYNDMSKLYSYGVLIKSGKKGIQKEIKIYIMSREIEILKILNSPEGGRQ